MIHPAGVQCFSGSGNRATWIYCPLSKNKWSKVPAKGITMIFQFMHENEYKEVSFQPVISNIQYYQNKREKVMLIIRECAGGECNNSSWEELSCWWVASYLHWSSDWTALSLHHHIWWHGWQVAMVIPLNMPTYMHILYAYISQTIAKVNSLNWFLSSICCLDIFYFFSMAVFMSICSRHGYKGTKLKQ